MKQANILIVDDDESFRLLLESHLKKAGFKPIPADSGIKALDVLDKNHVDLIISDQVMPEMDGIKFLAGVKSKHSDIPFIMLTAHGSIAEAVASIKKGAYDYIEKPYIVDDLFAAINRALDHYRLHHENKMLKDHLRDLYSFQNIVTKSPLMIKALKLAEKVSKSPNTTVAIYGESGTGKEVLARAVHYAGDRMGNRFVAVNCSAIPSTLLESELFGHVKGAFTGADRDREGKFGMAHGGTILLDEIGDMPLELQAKLLRVLQERVYEKLGSNKPVNIDCRVIVSTHRDLSRLVKDGRFREDLYHRINTFPISLPPLRQRKEDIPLLADHFIGQLRQELGKPIPGISQKAMDTLIGYRWPGNIREMKNCLERAAILTDGELINPGHFNICKTSDAGGLNEEDGNIRMEIVIPKEKFSLDSAIDSIVQFSLQRCGNNKAKAVQFLKVGRNFLYRRK
ncbi:MAG TPA: sigma-54-dependent Fis family transcriptional regulator [Nitrospiraceae bacterium]|nr:sigma-54-dependent Fis family transcriptional regulator [Nitrospiraceae bacterium]